MNTMNAMDTTHAMNIPSSMDESSAPGGARAWRSALLAGCRSVTTALGALLLGAMLAACAGCGGGGGSAGSPATPAAPGTPGAGATALLDANAPTFYPRLIRLKHQSDASLNGALLASTISFEGDKGQGRLFVSKDDGTSFQLQGTVSDTAWAKGLCCGSVFELPSAVGVLPAGTLLWSASVGQDTPGKAMEHPIYRSNDGGKTWNFLARCGVGNKPRGGEGTGIWEPEFLVARDGRLACLYSDETDGTAAGASQTLKLMSTADGTTWTAPKVIVDAVKPSDRPGMAVTSRLADGRYLLTYEHCSTAGLDCRVAIKYSADGLDWGDPAVRGAEPKTSDGRFFRHTPTHVQLATRQRIALVGQLLFNGAGQIDVAGNGKTVFLSSTADGSGTWTTLEAPVKTNAPAQSNWCQNYSSPLQPSADEKRLIMLASDFETNASGQQVCRTRFGSV
ncbi:sialidase family protein, partial [Mitsuaria sp. GD03876]|uniref:sialidase family protein n=1 Tax=Mitsuaria sp. GD03876 TaxID=2975399 RepID=UPI00244B52F8